MPYAGDIAYNTRMAIEYCRHAADRGVIPLAPHLLLPRFLFESNPREREQGVKMGLRLLGVCSELWVFGDRISVGMRREIAEAERLGIKIVYQDSNKIQGVMNMKQWGIWAKRGADSVCRAAEAWLKSSGKPLTFDSYEETAARAASLMQDTGTANVSYYPKEMRSSTNGGCNPPTTGNRIESR
ncbi:MAG: hypothetical protein A4E55_00386 [Pelotomaculum sp. PtaU1.Bin035]|nr:MAG: hypothetical protein A4E55_00386 [Pelotomaculum sp. PtaU1.Bin035]